MLTPLLLTAIEDLVPKGFRTQWLMSGCFPPFIDIAGCIEDITGSMVDVIIFSVCMM